MKTLKNIIALIFCIGVIGNQNVIAQGKTEKVNINQNKEVNEAHKAEMKALQEDMKTATPEEKEQIKDRMKDLKDEMKEDRDDVKDYYKEKKEKVEQRLEDDDVDDGNAYGKYKGDMSGREFGQARAAEAKNMVNNEMEVIREKELLVDRSRRRIETARSRADEAHKNNEITDEELEERNEKIRKAEEKLNELDDTIKKGKENMVRQKRRLSEIYVEE